MKRLVLARLCTLGLTLACIASPAVAFVPPTINIAPPFAMGNLQRELLERRQDQDASNAITAPPNPDRPASQSDFTYRYSPARTQQNLRNFVDRTPSGPGRAELEKVITTQPTLMEDIRKAIRTYGYDSHNVADAYSMWIMFAWLAAEGRVEDPDRGTSQKVAAQMRNALAATPDLQNLTDAQKQEYAEALLLQAFILVELMKASVDNPQIAVQLPQVARKGAKDHGVDLSLMTLTPNGFVPRKGADASDAVAGEDPIRNARADTPAGESESSSIGLALAAGAGLGVTLLGGLALMRRG